MSSVRDSLPIQGLSQWYRESGFPHRKPGLLHLPWCLVEFLPLKVLASCFDLELCFGCAKFGAKIGGI
jgi:hypothetical protein